ncbi:hypothetical protein AAFF_G00414080 [Aldrovandia affinis]|uniref:C-type lectin domain-containing protein n=1 Tax=Aldrovandia affinis TaxID=143900 RepID=A0AAD7R3M5_9TELE|nr:hypothetical protein AAFF_G00414080 [Aldrovandia affinis]
MISSVNTFNRKLQLLSTKLQRQDLRYFQNMHSELERQGKDTVKLDSARHIEQVQSISSEFDRRYIDFASLEPVATYMRFPFGTDIYVDDIASKVGSFFHLDTTAVENEILTLQNDIQMKSRATNEMKGEFWELLLEKYPNIMSALFGSTYPYQDVYRTVGQTSHNSPGAQNTERSGQSSFLKRLAAVCPWLLCALLLTAAIVLGVLYMRASPNCSMRCVEEPRANSSTLNQLQRDYNSLITQNTQLQRDVDTLVAKFPFLDQYCPLRSQKRVCRPCPEGWEQRNSTCYYFSIERKSWNASRIDCLKQGADLVIIESEEEQDFISKHTIGGGYWIGLSDSETEGTWLWVDGTPLQKDKAFWKRGQPNDYYGAEDCAFTVPGLNKWAAGPCDWIMKSICKTDALLL